MRNLKTFEKLNRAWFENYVAERDTIPDVIFLKDSGFVPQDDLYIGTGARISYFRKELHSSGYITYWVKVIGTAGSHTLKIEKCGNSIAVQKTDFIGKSILGVN